MENSEDWAIRDAMKSYWPKKKIRVGRFFLVPTEKGAQLLELGLESNTLWQVGRKTMEIFVGLLIEREVGDQNRLHNVTQEWKCPRTDCVSSLCSETQERKTTADDTITSVAVDAWVVCGSQEKHF